jgi:ubiquinone/menaquinone biosynthesis C-methylase UbiE
MRITLFFILIAHFCWGQDAYKNIYSSHAWRARDKWQQPDEIIKLLEIKPGGRVADIGCHEGYMSFKLAKAVGASGKVYAVDVDDRVLRKIRDSVDRSKGSPVEVIKGDYGNPKIPERELDAVLILDTYHEMDDHDKILQHILTALRPGGRLVICEPIAEERRKLARADQEKKHELAMKFALEDLARAGFKISFQKDPFIDRVKEKGDKMWVIVARKP